MSYHVHTSKPFYCTLILLIIFFWYPWKTSKSYKRKFFTVSVILRTFSVLSALGTAVHAYLVLKDNTDIDLSEDIADLGGCAGCMTVSVTFMLYHHRWSNFFNDLVDFKQFGKPPKYDQVVKRGNIISLICILYTIPGMSWYCFVSYLRIPDCKESNTRKGLNEICGMVNPTWVPNSAMNENTFLLFYLFQLTGVFLYIPSAFTLCALPLEAVEVIVARLNHLKFLFKDVFETKDRNFNIELLHHCISYHQDIIRVCKELSFLVKSSIGNIFVTAGFVIGSLGSQVLKESTPKAFAYVNGYLTALFLVCHAGQRLIDESLDVATYLYDSKWYEMDAKIKKDVVFILKRCQKPIHLEIPPLMGSAGYLLFGAMIHTSYSYLTLLNQMVSKSI